MIRRVAATTAAGLVLAAAFATPAAAHGIGGRRDLPVPLWQFLYAAAFALIISFLLLRVSWASPRFARAAAGRPLGAVADGSGRVLEILVRLVGLGLFALTISAAWFGDTNANNNIAPVMIYIALWVGLQVLSLLFGDVWAWLSPYDTIALATDRLRRGRGAAPAPAPDDASLVWSHWPAVLGILGFVWLELCYHSPAEPRVLAVLGTAYSVVVVAMAARHGRVWLRTGEAFAVLFGFIAQMAPLHRDAAGHVRLRMPFAGLAGFVPRRGSVAFVAVMLGGTAFDGVQRTRWWADVQGDAVGWERTAIATVGLVWVIAVVGVAYTAAARASARITGDDRRAAAARFVHSLVPIVVGYSIAHYFSLLITEGQALYPLFSNPYGKNWDLFGTVGYVIDLEPLAPRSIAWVQVLAIVGGHVAGVVVAHDRALEDHPHRDATRGQLPMLVVMIAFTLLGLTLLLKS